MPYKRQRQYTRSSKRGKQPKPYRSWLEYDLHQGVLKDIPFEPFSIPYQIEAKYNPDFVNEDKKILFEAKGRFADSKEAAKYVHFRRCNPSWELIFIFESPTLAFPHAKKRKDGTRKTHAEWATKNGFQWCCPKTIKEEWL